MMTPELQDWLHLHAAVTWALVGLIWVVQVVIYPAFALVGREDFHRYHDAHTSNITWVVAPLMLAEAGTACWLFCHALRESAFLWSLVPLGFNWLSTMLVQVPLHATLASGFDAAAHRRLVMTNWWRTAAWTLRGVVLWSLV